MKNIILTDSKGVVYKGREDGMNKYKEMFAAETELRTLKDAMKGADVFLGVSAKGLVTPEMLKSMNEDPIVFAMANPDPEITYEEAKAAREDVIIATGRSDYPNQINNVLGFPFIFRGALDVRAKEINEEMKKAASYAIAKVAKMPLTQDVMESYGGKHFEFGRDYIVPKPFDRRVAVEESFAVAKAAVESGVARKKEFDLDEYRKQLEQKFLKTT
jgi:malate dehydrogenase (oxaloacetate-decarboxylating)(NADP+)